MLYVQCYSSFMIIFNREPNLFNCKNHYDSTYWLHSGYHSDNVKFIFSLNLGYELAPYQLVSTNVKKWWSFYGLRYNRSFCVSDQTFLYRLSLLRDHKSSLEYIPLPFRAIERSLRQYWIFSSSFRRGQSSTTINPTKIPTLAKPERLFGTRHL